MQISQRCPQHDHSAAEDVICCQVVQLGLFCLCSRDDLFSVKAPVQLAGLLGVRVVFACWQRGRCVDFGAADIPVEQLKFFWRNAWSACTKSEQLKA